MPPVAAVIVTDPAAWPATEPLLETVATCWLLLDHVNVWPGMVAPLALRAVAVSCTD
jgi:hypothetical protein